MTAPSVEAVEYGRRTIAGMIERYQRFEREAAEAGQDAASRRFRAVHAALTRDLYGFDDGGCVIVPFDKRWLDDSFRAQQGAA